MFDEYIDPQGKIKIYVDGTEVSGVLMDGTPVPNMETTTAHLRYCSLLGNKGQEIIDFAAQSDNGIHEYKVEIADVYTWVYDGKIIHYEVLDKGFLGADVKIKLCGKFKYIRGTAEYNTVFDNHVFEV